MFGRDPGRGAGGYRAGRSLFASCAVELRNYGSHQLEGIGGGAQKFEPECAATLRGAFPAEDKQRLSRRLFALWRELFAIGTLSHGGHDVGGDAVLFGPGGDVDQRVCYVVAGGLSGFPMGVRGIDRFSERTLLPGLRADIRQTFGTPDWVVMASDHGRNAASRFFRRPGRAEFERAATEGSRSRSPEPELFDANLKRVLEAPTEGR